jgi:flagellar basal body-associated protein FliL
MLIPVLFILTLLTVLLVVFLAFIGIAVCMFSSDVSQAEEMEENDG